MLFLKIFRGLNGLKAGLKAMQIITQIERTCTDFTSCSNAQPLPLVIHRGGLRRSKQKNYTISSTEDLRILTRRNLLNYKINFAILI